MISEAQLTAPDTAPAARPQLPPRARTSSEGGGAGAGVPGSTGAMGPGAAGRARSTGSGTAARNPSASQAPLPPSGRSTAPGSAGGANAGFGATAGRSMSGGAASCSSLQRRSLTLSPSSSYAGGLDLDLDLELQVLNADREVLHDQLVAAEAANDRLTAEVTDLRRQLSTYEQLTRQAAGELVEIRRLKEAFQARLQRENDTLRAQLAQLGVQPIAPATHANAAAAAAGAGAGGPSAASSPQPPQQRQHPQLQHSHLSNGGERGGGGLQSPGAGAGSGEGALRRPQSFGGTGSQLVSAFEAAAAAAVNGRMAPPQSPLRYGVQSMAPFGSPASVAPPPVRQAPSGSTGGLWQAGGTPTRASSSFAAAAAAVRQPSRALGSPAAAPPPLAVSLVAAARDGGVSAGLPCDDRSLLSPVRATPSDTPLMSLGAASGRPQQMEEVVKSLLKDDSSP
ncbi:hypothetical protein Agub_g7607 [Astrephomene gubernaculifera]|uniref:Uncharacterized protein n=1 Tax=Astrephomene gubernaculifera TaxID=47775 RepID=A0AAD3DT11_9CHLO|nr:hypothetical protein Agub_g7607 [Astrephomene gubernaculifera]